MDVPAAVAVAEAVPPGRGVAEVAEQGVTGRGEVAGDLEGEDAAGGEVLDPEGEAVGVALDPLQGGVGDDQVVGAVGDPVGGVGGAEVEAAAPGGGALVGPGGLQHLGGAVEAGDAGGGPALREQGGHVAGAAADVGDPRALGGQLRYPGQQVVEGAGAVGGVTEILLGIPGCCGHVSNSLARDGSLPAADIAHKVPELIS